MKRRRTPTPAEWLTGRHFTGLIRANNWPPMFSPTPFKPDMSHSASALATQSREAGMQSEDPYKRQRASGTLAGGLSNRSDPSRAKGRK